MAAPRQNPPFPKPLELPSDHTCAHTEEKQNKNISTQQMPKPVVLQEKETLQQQSLSMFQDHLPAQQQLALLSQQKTQRSPQQLAPKNKLIQYNNLQLLQQNQRELQFGKQTQLHHTELLLPQQKPVQQPQIQPLLVLPQRMIQQQEYLVQKQFDQDILVHQDGRIKQHFPSFDQDILVQQEGRIKQHFPSFDQDILVQQERRVHQHFPSFEQDISAQQEGRVKQHFPSSDSKSLEEHHAGLSKVFKSPGSSLSHSSQKGVQRLSNNVSSNIPSRANSSKIQRSLPMLNHEGESMDLETSDKFLEMDNFPAGDIKEVSEQGFVEYSQSDVHVEPSLLSKKRRVRGGLFHQRKYKSSVPRGAAARNTDNVGDFSNIGSNFLQDCICPSEIVFDNEALQYCDEDFVESLSLPNDDLDIENYIKQSTEYQQRKEKYTKIFLENIMPFAEKFLESQFDAHRQCCGRNCTGDKNGSIFCDSGCGFLCHDCDLMIHSNRFHSRYFHGNRLDCGLYSNGERVDVILDLGIPKVCKSCDVYLQMKKSSEKLKIIKLNGIFVVNRSNFECPRCGKNENYSLEDYWTNRLFPLNCDSESSMMCSFDVLDHWRILKNVSPVTTVYSYIQCLCVASLNKFDTIYQQYQRLLLHIETEIFGINDFECIAKLAPHTFHMDGDLKCKHLKLSQNECDETQTYYGEKFFVPDSEVKQVTEYCIKKKLCSKKLSELNCGSSKWKAAGNKVNSKPSPVDIKGLQLASCTHLINAAGCNLLYGELFANNLLLTRKLLKNYDFEIGGSDVACKYGPWFKEKVCDAPEICEDLDIKPSAEVHTKPGEMQIFLGDLHSKGHCLDCRIKNGAIWNNVGRLQGLEMQEPQNNCFSRGRHRTAFQTTNRRQDEFSEMAYSINKKRNRDMIFILNKRLDRILKEIDELERKLKAEEKKENLKIDDELIDRVRSSAANMRSKVKSDQENEIEFLSLSLTVKKMQLQKTNDPGQKQKILENIRSHSKKLSEYVLNNNSDPSKLKLDWNDCLSGIFPWSAKLLPPEAQNKPAKFIELCELYLKIKNSVIEIDIIERDISAILQNRINIIERLSTGSEHFSHIINLARSEKQMCLMGDFLNELQAVKDSKRLNIDTDAYLDKLDLQGLHPDGQESRENVKEKMITEFEEKVQDQIISESHLEVVLTDVLTLH